MIFTTCPDETCDQPAEVLDAFALESTSGPVEHQKTRCAAGHHYCGPTVR